MPSGLAMPSNERPNENLEDIRRQLDEVKRHSDKLLSPKVAAKVQR